MASDDFMLRLLYPIVSRYCYPKSIARDELLIVRRANVRQKSFFIIGPNQICLTDELYFSRVSSRNS
jgi:hypothetical protein